jgi:EAL domain-containing protein (putative c-di-GMP-specific phosphodiesterase class I)
MAHLSGFLTLEEIMSESSLPVELVQLKPDAVENLITPTHPSVVLHNPDGLALPDGWQKPWELMGWTATMTARGEDGVSKQGGAAESGGDIILSVAILHDGENNGPQPTVRNLRRGDFLALMQEVATSKSKNDWALFAIRVDKSSEFAGAMDRTALFTLEEQIAARMGGILNPNEAFTIWLELGFGVLVRRGRDGGELEGQMLDLSGRLCKQIADGPFMVTGAEKSITVSIGMALPPKNESPESAQKWFSTAHAAQAIAARHGGNRSEGILTREFEPMTAERVLIMREWVQEAKTGNNVMLDFQPVLPLTKETAGLYWIHTKLRDYREPLGGAYRNEYGRLACAAGAMPIIDRLSLFGAIEALQQERSLEKDTKLLVPVDLSILDGVPWRWLEAELGRRQGLTNGLILEFEAGPALETTEAMERCRKLRDLGVAVGIAGGGGGLEDLKHWAKLPIQVARLTYANVEDASPELWDQARALWRGLERKIIVDTVHEFHMITMLHEHGVDYVCGDGIAAIGTRLDFIFT